MSVPLYMGRLIYVLEKTNRLHYMKKFTDQGFTWARDMNMKITQNQQTVI